SRKKAGILTSRKVSNRSLAEVVPQRHRSRHSFGGVCPRSAFLRSFMNPVSVIVFPDYPMFATSENPPTSSDLPSSSNVCISACVPPKRGHARPGCFIFLDLFGRKNVCQPGSSRPHDHVAEVKFIDASQPERIVNKM